MSTDPLTRTAPLVDVEQGPRRLILAMVLLMVLFCACALAWAVFARLDVAVRAPGAVVPSSRVQEIQSLEGGIVQELLVTEGQRVRKGELVAKLDTAQAASSLGENRQRYLAALAGRARVDALLSGGEPVFEAAWKAEAPALIDKQQQLWRDSQRDYQSSTAAAEQEVQQRSAELREAQARLQSLRESLQVARESFEIENKLYAAGAGARADFLAARQRMLSAKAEHDGVAQSIARLRAALSQAQSQLTQTGAKMRTQWGAERSEFETQAATLAATLEGASDRLTRRELFSPVDGTVNRILVPTRGGVALAGKPIIEIVPNEERLLISARVKPTDIGFLHPGQIARITVLAYDSATFGQMQGTVSNVGADAVVDDKGETYFEVQMTAEREQLRLNGKPLVVSPGMPVDASVLTGERSVMQYLLKPVLRGLQNALQER